MPAAKTATVTFRIDPAIKDALREAAEREHRSLANMVEVMIRDWCQRHRVVSDSSQEALAPKPAE